jgi:hypothetical protein
MEFTDSPEILRELQWDEFWMRVVRVLKHLYRTSCYIVFAYTAILPYGNIYIDRCFISRAFEPWSCWHLPAHSWLLAWGYWAALAAMIFLRYAVHYVCTLSIARLRRLETKVKKDEM